MCSSFFLSDQVKVWKESWLIHCSLKTVGKGVFMEEAGRWSIEAYLVLSKDQDTIKEMK